MHCVLCDKTLTESTERCITDCAHEFCLECLCRNLSDRRNECPICTNKVKVVHQVQDKATDPAPASIRFNNAIYVLHVSIWSVDDPARKLADLFKLEQARLVHKGKLLKKGDVWPGTVVQLFGTRRSSHRGLWQNYSYASLTTQSTTRLRQVKQILCCPFTVIFSFVRSMFIDDNHTRRGYERLNNPMNNSTNQPSLPTFSAPGRVSSPNYTDSVE